MSGPEAGATQGERNSELFYRTLIGALLRPAVDYTDAHYLRTALLPAAEFLGGTVKISDYPSYMLRAANEIVDAQRLANEKRLDAGQSVDIHGPTQADYRRLLEEGVAFMDISVTAFDGTQYSNIVGRPGDLAENNYVLQAAIDAGLEPKPEQPFVYDIGQGLYVPDPLQEPHLAALYERLNGAPGGAPPQAAPQG